MNLWQIVIAILILAILALTGVFLILGPERIWLLFGPADLGPVTFETLKRRSTPNDALACPPEPCGSEADILSPVFAVDVPTLRKALARALATERRLTLVDIDDKTPADRYIQRSERMRFPDTIVVRYFPLDGDRSTVAIYSRSQLGRSDLGVNLTRVERWLAKLEREVARIQKTS